jgi:8-oxo-dGTP pyrophosphatase MutT (NUDIX family)
MTTFQYCNNCGKYWHTYKYCKIPITSYGIINVNIKEQKYLMICRKYSLGFVEFMRGRYTINNITYLKNIIDEMTMEEKNMLSTLDFDSIWKILWGSNSNDIRYKQEEKITKEKMNQLIEGITYNNTIYTLNKLIKDSKTSWKEPEWGFPKGRRNYKESDINCALREYQEETGLDKSNIKILSNIAPYNEIFTGSNYKSYKHTYFIGIHQDHEMNFDNFQKIEVSSMKWFTIDEAISIIRPYNIEKIDLIKKIDQSLKEYKIL